MANFFLDNTYGNDYTKLPFVAGVSIQLHITAACDQKCKHCYMYNSPYYKPQIEHPLTKEQFFSLIDEYFEFLNTYNCSNGFIALTGGDPILSPHFWDILTHIHERPESCTVVIMGNPTHIYENEARRMHQLGVLSYQISIDGLKETHDYLRRPGSFDDSIRALRILHDAGVFTTVSFTVSKLNAAELIPLHDYLNSLGFVDSFGFNRMVPTGNAEQIAKEVFSPKEYRKFLFDVYRHEVLSGAELIIGKKDQLWRPLFYELGLVDPENTDKERRFQGGCFCGTETTSFLADGTMFPCRRLDIPSGKYPERSFSDLFINSEVTRDFLNHEHFSGCNECDVNPICRGCPSMKYAVTGDFYAHDPNCWRVENDA